MNGAQGARLRAQGACRHPPRGRPTAARTERYLPGDQTFAGLDRAASFLGLDEEYMIVIGRRWNCAPIQPAERGRLGDAVDVTVRPEDCIVFAARHACAACDE